MNPTRIILSLCSLFFTLAAYANTEYLDFSTFETPEQLNHYLVCPKDFCKNAKTDRYSHAYDLPPAKLVEAWNQMIAEQPRVTQIFADPEHGQWRYEQKMWLLQFPFEVTVQFIPLSENSTTFAIYSESIYGYYDFNLNGNRIQAWLTNLDEKVAELLRVQQSGNVH